VRATSVTASRSFCEGGFLVKPVGFSILFVRLACRAANLGLLCSTELSIGGSILLFSDLLNGNVKWFGKAVLTKSTRLARDTR